MRPLVLSIPTQFERRREITYGGENRTAAMLVEEIELVMAH